jgi:hypothetical protein
MITTEYKEPLEQLETDFRFTQAAEAQNPPNNLPIEEIVI